MLCNGIANKFCKKSCQRKIEKAKSQKKESGKIKIQLNSVVIQVAYHNFKTEFAGLLYECKAIQNLISNFSSRFKVSKPVPEPYSKGVQG